MKELSSIYKPFDVVIVPFPFTDKAKSKLRPALVLSSEKYFNYFSGQTILAMITSADSKISWQIDLPIKDIKSCGLINESIIRLKLFTLDNDLIKSKIGKLSKNDQILLKENLTRIFDYLI